jgi:hypothetical protein
MTKENQQANKELFEMFPEEMGFILSDLAPFDWKHIAHGKFENFIEIVPKQLYYLDSEDESFTVFQKKLQPEKYGYEIYLGSGGSREVLFKIGEDYFWHLKLLND